MAMIKNPTFSAIALLLFAAILHAQDEVEDIPGAVDENEIPDDFLQQGQIVPVADEGIEEGEDFSIPEEDSEDLLFREFELFKQLMQDGILDEADSVAKRVIELAIRSKGPQSNEYAKALTNLAIVQFQTGQFDAAQQNFEAAIEIIEDNEDRLNEQLVNPLKGLGAAQLKGGRPDLAIATYQRAIHVTHVNEGPHNLDQVEILESTAETFMEMGDIDSAKDAQDSIYALNIRKHQLDSADLIPSLMRRAAWQHRAGFIYDERTTYRRVIRIIEETEDKDSLHLVEPLIMLGRSFFYYDTSGSQSYSDAHMTSGEIYFRRAVRIAAEHPDANWQTTAQATLALGDFYMYDNNPQRGRSAYLSAWDMLSENDARLSVRHEQLESIVPLRLQKLPQYVNKSDDEAGLQNDDPLLQGNITISYDVSDRGRATNIKLIEAEPAEFERMTSSANRELRRRIYRPRFEDGDVVDTPDQLLVHKYFYRQSDLDSIRAAAEAAKKD